MLDIAKLAFNHRMLLQQDEYNKRNIEQQHELNSQLIDKQIRWTKLSIIVTALATRGVIHFGMVYID